VKFQVLADAFCLGACGINLPLAVEAGEIGAPSPDTGQGEEEEKESLTQLCV